MTSPDAERRYTTYGHPWRVPRGHSLLDPLLNWGLVLLATLLCIEGVLPKYIPGTRSLPFYLMVVLSLIAFLRLPLLIHKVFSASGLVLIFATFALSIWLYFFTPVRPNREYFLLIQLMVMTVVFLYVASDIVWRQRLAWGFWFGWVLLIIVSFYEFSTGNATQLTVGIVRYEVAGFSPAFHSTYVGTGLAVAITLTIQSDSNRFTRLLLLLSVALGTIVLLMSNTRSGTLFAILTTILLGIVRFGESINSGGEKSNPLLWYIMAIVAAVLALSQTSLGEELLDAQLARFSTISEGDFSQRDVLFENGLQIALENPIGVGQGNSLYYMRSLFGKFIDPHNYHLRILIESGFIGFILYILGLGAITINGWCWYKQPPVGVFFWGFVFLLMVTATAQAFHYKIMWFFIALNAAELNPARKY